MFNLSTINKTKRGFSKKRVDNACALNRQCD